MQSPLLLLFDTSYDTAAIGAIATIVVGVLVYAGYRGVNRATARKTGTETFFLEVDKFLDLLRRIEVSHKKSIEDESTIADLREQVERCVAGDGVTCLDLTRSALQFCRHIEEFLNRAPHTEGLEAELQNLTGRLEKACQDRL